MISPSEDAVRSRKLGSENAIVVQLPTDRFRTAIPSHHRPPVDEQGCYSVMLLAQDCSQVSFGDDQAGLTRELHLWLLLSSSVEASPIDKADTMLPSKDWLALAAATDNPLVESNLRSFGFDPLRLASVELRCSGGSVALQDGARLECDPCRSCHP